MRVVQGLLSVLSAAGARWTSRAPCRIEDVQLTLCGDANLVDLLEEHVPVRMHRCLHFRRGDAVSLWTEQKRMSHLLRPT